MLLWRLVKVCLSSWRMEVLSRCRINKSFKVYGKGLKFWPKFKCHATGQETILDLSNWAKDHVHGYGKQSTANTMPNTTVTEKLCWLLLQICLILLLINLQVFQWATIVDCQWRIRTTWTIYWSKSCFLLVWCVPGIAEEILFRNNKPYHLCKDVTKTETKKKM